MTPSCCDGGWAEGLPTQLEDFPTAAVLAPEHTVTFPAYLGGDMTGHHGGITPQEILTPLLVA